MGKTATDSMHSANFNDELQNLKKQIAQLQVEKKSSDQSWALLAQQNPGMVQSMRSKKGKARQPVQFNLFGEESGDLESESSGDDQDPTVAMLKKFRQSCVAKGMDTGTPCPVGAPQAKMPLFEPGSNAASFGTATNNPAQGGMQTPGSASAPARRDERSRNCA